MNFLLVPIFLIYGYVASISMSMSKDRYRRRIIFSLFSVIIGTVLEIYFKQESKFLYLVFGLLPLIHIIYYEILRVIFKPVIGKFPYSPFREKIGAKVIGSSYPKNRKVKVADYIFGFTLIFVPLITVILLGIVLGKYFR